MGSCSRFFFAQSRADLSLALTKALLFTVEAGYAS